MGLVWIGLGSDGDTRGSGWICWPSSEFGRHWELGSGGLPDVYKVSSPPRYIFSGLEFPYGAKARFDS